MVVHRLIEEFVDFFMVSGGEATEVTIAGALSEFGLRTRARLALHAVIDEEFGQNPRIDPTLLKATVSVDECLNRFKRILRAKGPTTGRLTQRGTSGSSQGLSLQGAEVELRTEAPPLIGRVDTIQQGVIIDYKTGSPHPAHVEQLELYALMYYLVHGRSPHGLALVYSSQPTPERVPVPTIEALEQAKIRLCDEIHTIREVLQTCILPSAVCSVEICRYCPVRQHCDDYWQSPATQELRGTKLATLDLGWSTAWCDVEVTRLRPEWGPGRSVVARVEAGVLGTVSITIPRDRVPNVRTTPVHGMRILDARITRPRGQWEVAVTGQAEVFWVADH